MENIQVCSVHLASTWRREVGFFCLKCYFKMALSHLNIDFCISYLTLTLKHCEQVKREEEQYGKKK